MLYNVSRPQVGEAGDKNKIKWENHDTPPLLSQLKDHNSLSKVDTFYKYIKQEAHFFGRGSRPK